MPIHIFINMSITYDFLSQMFKSLLWWKFATITGAKTTSIIFIWQVSQVISLNLNEEFWRIYFALKLVEYHIDLVFVILKSANKHFLLLIVPLLKITHHGVLKILVGITAHFEWGRLYNWVASSNLFRSSALPSLFRKVIEPVCNTKWYYYFFVHVFQIIWDTNRHVNPLSCSLKSRHDFF